MNLRVDFKQESNGASLGSKSNQDNALIAAFDEQRKAPFFSDMDIHGELFNTMAKWNYCLNAAGDPDLE